MVPVADIRLTDVMTRDASNSGTSVGVDADLDEFCSRLHPRLVRALGRSYRDADLAEDLAQEALSRTVEKWDHIRAVEKPEDYVFRIAFNLGRSWWRRRCAEWRAQSRLDDAVVWCDHDPTAGLEVRGAVSMLTPRQREAIVNRYFLGLDVRGAAVSMKCAEGTVRALTSQAIAALRSSDLGVDNGR
jgi:DNA-directed RNA polymerase specialized sigma24 family protein